MTTENQNKPKQIPAFYIFAQGEDGKSQRIGAAFRHGKGNGLSVVIGNSRYVAFQPKAKTENPEKGA